MVDSIAGALLISDHTSSHFRRPFGFCKQAAFNPIKESYLVHPVDVRKLDLNQFEPVETNKAVCVFEHKRDETTGLFYGGKTTAMQRRTKVGIA